MSTKYSLINFAMEKPGKHHLNQLKNANTTSNGTNQHHVPLDRMHWELPQARACLVNYFIPGSTSWSSSSSSLGTGRLTLPRRTGHISSHLIFTSTPGSEKQEKDPRPHNQWGREADTHSVLPISKLDWLPWALNNCWIQSSPQLQGASGHRAVAPRP